MSSWLFADLHRPQYPPTPDVVQSALAWSFFKPVAEDVARGFVFLRQSTSQPRNVRVVSTRPDIVDMSSWVSALRSQKLFYDGGPRETEVAYAVSEALIGVEPRKGAGQTAAPLGVSAALLQDPSGAMGVAGPPNFAGLLNHLYLLGSMSRDTPTRPTRMASELWFDAVKKIASGNPILQAIDGALYQSTISNIVDDSFETWPPAKVTPNKSSIPASPPAWWTGDGFDSSETPFGWFCESWRKLCSDEWISALPPRRWTDWASCLIRQALAFCFLWEAHLLAELGRFVVEKKDTVEEAVARIRFPPLGLVSWLTAGSITALDVKPRMRDLLRMGHACRKALWEWQDDRDPPKDNTLAGMLAYVRKNASTDLRRALTAAVRGSDEAGGLNNLVETVEYSLLCRRETGRSADFYGFTKTVSNRFTHVAPSPEWIVVLSGVAAAGPNHECRLSDVLASLRRLGLQPRIDTLVRELERAGLCASAPDADEGIVISPAFGG